MNRVWKKGKWFIVCMLIGAAVTVTAVLFLRLRGSVAVKPGRVSLPPGEVSAYRQDDAAWAQDLLGKSRFTMESSGCLVTCIASAVSTETDKAVTPGALNTAFSEKNVYDSAGNIQWAAIDAIDGLTAVVCPDAAQADIDAWLAAGHYPIVRVRMHGLGSFHYVLIVGVEDGAYLCMDPLKSGLTRLSDYQNRVYAVRVVHCDF
ncbi:MAG: hypothetical protein K2P39_01405 [Lachnospiraceae bacterium]|nr:hypothetical protein [Lachnospiraceae bacterium]